MSPGNWAPQVAGHAQSGMQKTGMDHPPSALTACRKPFEGAVDSCSARCSLRRRPGPMLTGSTVPQGDAGQQYWQLQEQCIVADIRSAQCVATLRFRPTL